MIPAFRKQFPKVHLSLAEGSPAQLAEMVLHEQADLALATESLALTPGLATLPVYAWEHTVVVRPDHPLTELTSSAAKRLSLAQLAEYPSSPMTAPSRAAARSTRSSPTRASTPTSCSKPSTRT